MALLRLRFHNHLSLSFLNLYACVITWMLIRGLFLAFPGSRRLTTFDRAPISSANYHIRSHIPGRLLAIEAPPVLRRVDSRANTMLSISDSESVSYRKHPNLTFCFRL
jgi:hypothetical protein